MYSILHISLDSNESSSEFICIIYAYHWIDEKLSILCNKSPMCILISQLLKALKSL